MEKYQVVAWLPGTQNVAVVAPDGQVGYVNALQGPFFVPQFPTFIDAAVVKYGYRRIKPVSVSLQGVVALVQQLEGGYDPA